MEIGQNNSWQHIIVISSDLALERARAEEIQTAFGERGFTTERRYAKDMAEQQAAFTELIDTTRDAYRNVFVVGTETFYRKLLCAAIQSGAKKGIAWMSEGTWRAQWWNKSEQAFNFNQEWVRDEAPGKDWSTSPEYANTENRLLKAYKEFQDAWDNLTKTNTSLGSDAQRRVILQANYTTQDSSYPNAPEKYHTTHYRWHSVYETLLIEKGYYDIFFMDVQGNVIYSVHKNRDFGEDFSIGGGGTCGSCEKTCPNGEADCPELCSNCPDCATTCQDSGLGEAFEAAKKSRCPLHRLAPIQAASNRKCRRCPKT
jgi:hypothetical protein